jgi:hypothetical protein
MTVEEDDLPAEVLNHPAAWTGCTAGALTEHDFARKLDRAGFGQVQIVDRQPQSIDDLAVYSLFPAGLLQLIRTHIPPGKHARITPRSWSKLSRDRTSRTASRPHPFAHLSPKGEDLTSSVAFSRGDFTSSVARSPWLG